MKMILKNMTIFLVLVFLASCGASNKIAEPSASSRALDEMVTGGQFVFEAEWARPLATSALNSAIQGGLIPPGNSASQINIMGSSFFFKMEKDSVSANLPYYGERQMGGGYGTDNGILFEGIPTDLKVEKDEAKLKYNITFNMSKQTETYRCRLELFPNQTGTLLINSSHRTTIRYEGKVAELADAEVQ